MSVGRAAPGYRLPSSTRLGAVRLMVGDLSRSVDFYQQVLGLTVLGRGPRNAVLGLSSGHVLLNLEWPHGATRPQGPRLGLYHFAFLVPDRAALGRFLTHAAGQRAKVASADHAVSEALYLWDPDGLGIEVYRDRPRTEWRANGDEIFMTTEPLDIRDLLEAANGPWAGMPDGTALGHMHLQVSDLEHAAAFYHRALGFDQMVWSYPGALFLGAGGYHHHVGANTWAGHARARADNEAGLLGWEMVLPSINDVLAAASSCASAGVTVSESHGDATLIDPWGTEVRLRTPAG